MNRKWRRDCPYCGRCVGIVGNWMAILFGTRIHSCDFSKYTFSKYLEMHDPEGLFVHWYLEKVRARTAHPHPHRPTEEAE